MSERIDERPAAGSAASTRDRVLDAAERLFAERGFEGTSLRAVTQAAGVNLAAVNYHFGSKEGLVAAVVRRAMSEVNAERERRLLELHRRGRTLAVADVVRAFVETGAELVPRVGRRSLAPFVGRVISDPSPRLRRIFAAEVHEVEGRYLEALIAALPHVSAAEVRLRYTAMVGVLGLDQLGVLRDMARPAAQEDATAPIHRERLIAFLAAALAAPPASGEPRR